MIENKRSKPSVFFAVANFTILFLVASVSPSLADRETIALLTKNQSNPLFQSVRIASDEAARELNAKVIQYAPVKPDNIAEQIREVEDAISRNVDAMILVPIDYKALGSAIREVNQAKIPILDYLDRWEAGEFSAYVGLDSYNMAVSIGRYLFKQMGGKGSIIILEGPKGASSAIQAQLGFKKALEEFPDVKVLASQPGDYQKLKGLQVTENLLQRFPKIDGVLAANDAMALGAVEALDGASRQSLVVGINGTSEAVAAIKAHKMLASGDYDAFKTGCIVTYAAIRILRKQPVPKEIVTPIRILDSTNYPTAEVPLEQRKCGRWEDLTPQ